jgi:hypothetical protein
VENFEMWCRRRMEKPVELIVWEMKHSAKSRTWILCQVRHYGLWNLCVRMFPFSQRPLLSPTSPHVLIFCSASPDQRLWFWSGNRHHRNSLQAAQSKFLFGRQPGQGPPSTPRSRSEVFCWV